MTKQANIHALNATSPGTPPSFFSFLRLFVFAAARARQGENEIINQRQPLSRARLSPLASRLYIRAVLNARARSGRVRAARSPLPPFDLIRLPFFRAATQTHFTRPLWDGQRPRRRTLAAALALAAHSEGGGRGRGTPQIPAAFLLPLRFCSARFFLLRTFFLTRPREPERGGVRRGETKETHG